MRFHWIPLILFLIANFAVDWGIFKHLTKPMRASRWAAVAHTTIAAVLFAVVVAAMVIISSSPQTTGMLWVEWLIYTYLAFYIPKYLWLIVNSISLLPFLTAKTKKFVKACASCVAVLTFIIMWWGALITPRTHDVTRQTLYFSNLPKEFDGYRIVHISDMHLLSYGSDTTFVSSCVDAVNALQPDIVCFTGDLVSMRSCEAFPFRSVLSRLKARDGVLSVLGNHDYDDYVQWPTEAQKMADRDSLRQFQASVGWTLLNNATHTVKRDPARICFIGTENYGDPPFPKYGNLRKAYPWVNDSRFKILLQHNPYAWRTDIVGKTNIQLMLSGHTHAMQVMLSVFGHRYSPAAWRYKEWGGAYKKGGQVLYVNIGLGEVGIPARIGATPEITLITLKKKQ